MAGSGGARQLPWVIRSVAFRAGGRAVCVPRQAWMGLLSFKPVIHQIRIVRQMVPCLLAVQPPGISLVISCIFLILCLELRFLCCWQPAALRSAAPPLFQANSSQPVWRTRLSQRTKTREHACCNAAIRSTFWLPQQLAYLPTSNGKQQQTPTLPTALPQLPRKTTRSSASASLAVNKNRCTSLVPAAGAVLVAPWRLRVQPLPPPSLRLGAGVRSRRCYPHCRSCRLSASKMYFLNCSTMRVGWPPGPSVIPCGKCALNLPDLPNPPSIRPSCPVARAVTRMPAGSGGGSLREGSGGHQRELEEGHKWHRLTATMSTRSHNLQLPSTHPTPAHFSHPPHQIQATCLQTAPAQFSQPAHQTKATCLQTSPGRCPS